MFDLSPVDAIDHGFGASKSENWDIVLRLDRMLADIFTFMDQTVGQVPIPRTLANILTV